MTGIVKWYSTKAGYGFAVAEEGTEYFVHQTEIRKDGYRFLKRGDIVDFDPERNLKGKNRAANVRLIS